VRWDLAVFVEPCLATGPVDEGEILIERHEEAAAV
jgi:hypothetical protein